jgi:hypothetical protein
MKALKEKRISLRSLWRRGLVILSLFALVFVSCGDSESSDSNNDTGTGGKRVASIEVRTDPTATQYMGKPIDLTGLVVRVRYTDGLYDDIAYETDKGKFTTWPRVTTGAYYESTSGATVGKNLFKGLAKAVLYYTAGGQTFDTTINLARVIGILRENTPGYDPDPITAYPGTYDRGLNVTGVGNMKTTEYRVDDTDIDWSGLKLEVNYEDGGTGELSFRDVNWKIIPYYVDGTGASKKRADGTYPGYIFITVGRLVIDENSIVGPYTVEELLFNGSYPSGTNWNYEGITASVPLTTVYPVKEDGITFVSTPELNDFFFWQANTDKAWADRLIAAGAELKITYAGIDNPRVISVEDLVRKENIWYNYNPGYTWDPEYYEKGEPFGMFDFYVAPIGASVASSTSPYDKKANPNPAITIYYRGDNKLTLPVNVFTKLVSINAEPKTAGEVEWDVTHSGRDNDIEYGTKNEKTLAALFNVTATYSAYNDTSKQSKPLTLAYGEDVSGGAVLGRGAYYSVTGYPTYATGELDPTTGWKTGVTKAITFTHFINGSTVDTYFSQYVGTDGYIGDVPRVSGTTTKTAKSNVKWTTFRK